MIKDISLRSTFNRAAEIYDKIRPGYPKALFNELINKSNINKNSKLLEIGAGTGQATLKLARCGYNITAVELGDKLSEILKRNISAYNNCEVLTGAFEDLEFQNKSFDLIYSATAFHWVNPEVKFTKTHKLLKPGGYLAIISSAQIFDEAGDKFFHASQPIYNKYWKSDPKNPFTLKKLHDVKPDEIDENLFTVTYFNCFPRTIIYNSTEYCGLLNADSEKLALPPDKRNSFLNEMKKLIDKKFSNRVSRRYANSLTIAKKK